MKVILFEWERSQLLPSLNEIGLRFFHFLDRFSATPLIWITLWVGEWSALILTARHWHMKQIRYNKNRSRSHRRLRHCWLSPRGCENIQTLEFSSNFHRSESSFIIFRWPPWRPLRSCESHVCVCNRKVTFCFSPTVGLTRAASGRRNFKCNLPNGIWFLASYMPLSTLLYAWDASCVPGVAGG